MSKTKGTESIITEMEDAINELKVSLLIKENKLQNSPQSID